MEKNSFSKTIGQRQIPDLSEDHFFPFFRTTLEFLKSIFKISGGIYTTKLIQMLTTENIVF